MERRVDELIEADFARVDWWRTKRPKVEEATRANFEAWYWGVCPDLMPVAIEETFRVLLDETERRRIWLTGTPDWLDVDGRILDWKNPSAKSEWQFKMHRSEMLKYDIQSTVYTYALASQTDDWSPKQFELVLLMDGEIGWISIERGPADWAALKDKCVALADLIQAPLTVWPHSWNSWYCSPDWCASWATCRGAHYNGEKAW
jgi:hypothetical protein